MDRTIVRGGVSLGRAATRSTKQARSNLISNGSLAKLIQRISPKRQNLLAPILREPRSYVLLSMRQMAGRLGCAPATMLRIIREMGFPSFHDFRRYLHDLTVSLETPLNVMEQHRNRKSGLLGQIELSLDQDQGNLRALRHGLDLSRVVGLAKRLHEARRIVILGGDLAISLAHFLDYNLNVIGLDTISLTTPGQVAHRTRQLARGDVVIAISYRRGLRQTVEGMQVAHSRGAYCIGISDSTVSPIARYAHECFVTPSDGPTFSGSYTAAMAFLNVILVACANYRRSHTLTNLKDAEREQRIGFRWYIET